MNDKPFYKSKKWWMAIAGAISMIIGNYLGIDPTTLLEVFGLIIIYILGQAGVDIAKSVKK